VRVERDLLLGSVDLLICCRTPPFAASTYSKDRARLLRHVVPDLFCSEVATLARRYALDLQRALQHGCDADRGVGLDEELPASRE
jgi:hypothetical protein